MRGVRQGQCSASLPHSLGREKEGWRAKVGGMGWAEEEKNARPLKFAKKKKPPTLEGRRVLVKLPFFVPGLSRINFNSKSLQTEVELSLRKSFAQVFSSRDGRR